MRKNSILIVEDEAIVAYDLARQIRQLGYDIAGTASTGEEAIELARLHRPALVLMDIQLAGAMNGIEAAEQIHRECNLPILFLTANIASDSAERMLQAGSVGRIMKPFDKHDLQTQIEKALKQTFSEEIPSKVE